MYSVYQSRNSSWSTLRINVVVNWQTRSHATVSYEARHYTYWLVLNRRVHSTWGAPESWITCTWVAISLFGLWLVSAATITDVVLPAIDTSTSGWWPKKEWVFGVAEIACENIMLRVEKVRVNQNVVWWYPIVGQDWGVHWNDWGLETFSKLEALPNNNKIYIT